MFRGNQKPHLNKSLRVAIMKRSRLKNKATKFQLLADLSKYKKQRSLVVKLNKKHKKNILKTSMLLLTQNLFGISVNHIFQISTQRVCLTLRSLKKMKFC